MDGSAEVATRRQVLRALGGVTLVIGGAAIPLASLWEPAAADGSADKALATFAESIELAATAAYGVAARTGKLTTPAVLQTAELFASHHKAHAAAYGAYAGDTARAVANPKLTATVTPLLSAAADQAGLVKVLYGLENALAATYLATTGELSDPTALEATASILPVESQHATVLGHVLGEALGDQGTFIPAFLTTSAAIMADQYPITPGT